MYFNTTFSSAMVGDGRVDITTITPEMAATNLKFHASQGTLYNIANPRHENTLQAISQVLGVDVTTGATGARVRLESGDVVLVAELDASALPRETREFTAAEIAACRLVFRLVAVNYRCRECGA